MSIQVYDIVKRYANFNALDHVDLKVEAGELIALLGPSGSGKTTLLRVLAGLETPEQGRVFIHDKDATEDHVRKRRVGFVFQHYALFKHLTIFENIAFGLRVRPAATRPSNDEIKRRVFHLLEMVQLSWVADRYPHQLSGGQRQRIALARALAVEPSVLLLDEPFGALDAKVRQELRNWLRKLHDELHITSVFVTHDQEEALEVADRVVIMDKGKIIQVGTPADVWNKPATPFVYEFLGNANRFEGGTRSEVLNTSRKLVVASAVNVERAEPITYVRPRDFTIDVEPRDGSGIKAQLLSARILGLHAVLKAKPESGGKEITVEIDSALFTELHIETGETIYLYPQKTHVFAHESEASDQWFGPGSAI